MAWIWVVRIPKSRRILCVTFSTMDTCLCICHLVVWSIVIIIIIIISWRVFSLQKWLVVFTEVSTVLHNFSKYKKMMFFSKIKKMMFSMKTPTSCIFDWKLLYSLTENILNAFLKNNFDTVFIELQSYIQTFLVIEIY